MAVRSQKHHLASASTHSIGHFRRQLLPFKNFDYNSDIKNTVKQENLAEVDSFEEEGVLVYLCKNWEKICCNIFFQRLLRFSVYTMVDVKLEIL